MKMTSRMEALESWAAGFLGQLQPGSRNKLAREIGLVLRRSQQQRITAQRNPDASKYVPRKPRHLRGKRGRIKRSAKMFQKLKMVKYLKMLNGNDSISIGFTERIARIAKVHQYGLNDHRHQHERRAILGFSDSDLHLIRTELFKHFISYNLYPPDKPR